MIQPCVYLITNLVSGKVYVGKTNNAKRRWSAHRTSARSQKPRSAIAGAIKKYGSANFQFTVLMCCASEDVALQWEQWWIRFLGSNQSGQGYNLDAGGHGGKTLTPSTRLKISQALKGRLKSPEARAHMRAAVRVKPSPETVAKRAASNRGRLRSDDQCRRISEAKKGQTYTEEQRARMSAAHIGHRHTEEHKAKIAAAIKHSRAAKKYGG